MAFCVDTDEPIVFIDVNICCCYLFIVVIELAFICVVDFVECFDSNLRKCSDLVDYMRAL